MLTRFLRRRRRYVPSPEAQARLDAMSREIAAALPLTLAEACERIERQFGRKR